MLAGAFELFRIGIGPSSSHTVAPMRAAALVARDLHETPVSELRVILHGSLALTGQGHGTDRALVAGLGGADPETVDPATVRALAPTPQEVRLPGAGTIRYHLNKQARGGPPGHPNALRFVATDRHGQVLVDRTYRSIGGGFLTQDGVADAPPRSPSPHAYASGAELVAHAERLGTIAAVAAANEAASRPAAEVTDRSS